MYTSYNYVIIGISKVYHCLLNSAPVTFPDSQYGTHTAKGGYVYRTEGRGMGLVQNGTSSDTHFQIYIFT